MLRYFRLHKRLENLKPIIEKKCTNEDAPLGANYILLSEVCPAITDTDTAQCSLPEHQGSKLKHDPLFNKVQQRERNSTTQNEPFSYIHNNQHGGMALSSHTVMHRAIMHSDTQALLQTWLQHMQASHSHTYRYSGLAPSRSITNNQDLQIRCTTVSLSHTP